MLIKSWKLWSIDLAIEDLTIFGGKVDCATKGEYIHDFFEWKC